MEEIREENDSLLDKEDTSMKSSEFNFSFLFFVTFVGCLGGFFTGYNPGATSGVILSISTDFPEITTTEKSLVVSLTPLGGFFGALIAGPLSDRYGRKPIIQASDAVFLVGTLIQVATQWMWLLLVGRFVMGIGLGVVLMIVPLYLSEIAPIRVRGTMVTFFVSALTFGQLVASIISYYLEGQWRPIFAIGAIPGILQFILMFQLPETQRWLISKEQDPKEVLSLVYEQQFVEQEYENLSSELQPEGTFTELFSKYRGSTIIACTLMACQQMIGIQSILINGPQLIMDDLDIVEEYGLCYNIALNAVVFLGTAISLTMIDSIGRKQTILWTLPILFVSLVLMAFTHDKLFVLSIFIYLGAFSIGFSSTVWAINSEIFPIHLAGRAVALSNAVSWLSYFLVVTIFMTVRENYEMAQYLVYAGITMLTYWFIHKVPETKGKSISENIKNIQE